MNVGVLSRGYEPFVFVDGDDYSGISIEIWERVADKLNIDYKYVDAGTSLNTSTSSTVRFPLTANLVPIRKAAHIVTVASAASTPKKYKFFS